MRAPSVSSVASLAFVAAAFAATVSASGAAAQPMRKDGLWEMTMKMSSPMTMTVTSRQCTDAAQEKAGAMFRNGGPQGGGFDCQTGVPIPAAGGGWTYSTTCTTRNMTLASTGTVRGDFNSGYHLDAVTHMTPAPMPQMAENHMSMDAKWLGPCPADMKPGDMEINGRRISARH